MISHSRVWSQNMLLFDPLLVFLGTARMKDSQRQTSQEDGKGGNGSTNRSLCLLQPEPLEVWYFLYTLTPKEGTLLPQETEGQRKTDHLGCVQHSRGQFPIATNFFFFPGLLQAKF